jgi:hypothetical protein
MGQRAHVIHLCVHDASRMHDFAELGYCTHVALRYQHPPSLQRRNCNFFGALLFSI